MIRILRFLTSGESHGRGLSGIIEGIPSGLSLCEDDISCQLKRRQGGHGRGGRMKIEQDLAQILSGVRWGKTLGSPIALFIENRDWKNWDKGMSAAPGDADSIPPVTKPRPGHADLAGALKYNHTDVRNILERSSARETAMRVALGAVARRFLSDFGMSVGSYVTGIGGVHTELIGFANTPEGLKEAFKAAEESPVRCPDPIASRHMMEAIDAAARNGDTVGGVFEVFVLGLPVGLGSHVQWDRRLDGRLAQAVMSVQAIKAVEVGTGFQMAERPGSEVMDEIFYEEGQFSRQTNHSGGIEGGMSNAMPVVVRAAMKPIPTLRKALRSADLVSKEPLEAAYERSDTCAVPAAAVVAEAMTALIVADAVLEKFGGDSMDETHRNFKAYLEYVKNF